MGGHVALFLCRQSPVRLRGNALDDGSGLTAGEPSTGARGKEWRRLILPCFEPVIPRTREQGCGRCRSPLPYGLPAMMASRSAPIPAMLVGSLT